MKTRTPDVLRISLAGLGFAALLGTGLFLTRNAQAKSPAPTKIPAPAGRVTPWEAIKLATAKVPGQALNANFEFDEGHWVYGVMIVTNTTPKKIKEVELDPMTGKVGDVEEITPEGEAKEVTSELNKALGKSAKAAPESGEKGEKD